MKSIKKLFKETSNYSNLNHDDRMNRRLRYLPFDCLSHIPRMKHPSENSNEFKKDFDEVVRCHNQPCMNTDFLTNTDDSVESLFKQLCNENGHNNIDWEKIKDIIEDVDSCVLKLKYENNRPRPVHYLKDIDGELKIKYKKSPSFPSGHTTIAYFLCDVISNSIPDLKQDMQTLASLIGQSRIENGVHFPTDVEYGRLVGEQLANDFINQGSNSIEKKLTKKDYKYFQENVIKRNNLEDVASFIHRTCEIEKYYVNYADCLEAVNFLAAGISPEYATNNNHIVSQINGLVLASKLGKIDSNYKVSCIHNIFKPEILERGTPGEFRNFTHRSPSGVNYPEPYRLFESLSKCHKYNDDPWTRHVLYEFIHPFCDGNGRSGRIILASDLNFNFADVNNYINETYLDRIISGIRLIDENSIRFL